MKARGRYDIIVPFASGGYIRFFSKKDRSLTAAEILECLKEYIGYIEVGVKAEAQEVAEQKRKHKKGSTA